MNLTIEGYAEQARRWPTNGEHILAQFDDASVVVYQAYRPSTGSHAIEHGRLGGPDFSFERMSWIKPNFLWMMYRSGWGTKPGQEVILGLRIRRTFFEDILDRAVASSYDPSRHPTHEHWKAEVQGSDVRLQWDPDHAPDGSKLGRRAIQLGLRGDALKALAGPELLEVIDVSGFVAQQRPHALADWSSLLMPKEQVYPRSSHSQTAVVR
ncbi:DUF4291 domain-containing protein [Ideonella sp.]|uniref:DUF4291 domain-containing protein n=1 Tax=Ideonella sp. TaxID=1929293 RepID=UPI003BB7AE35